MEATRASNAFGSDDGRHDGITLTSTDVVTHALERAAAAVEVTPLATSIVMHANDTDLQ